MPVINELITIRVIEQNDKQRYSIAIMNLLICLTLLFTHDFSFKLLIPRSLFKGSGSFLYSWHSDMAKRIIGHPMPMAKYELIPPPADLLGFYLLEN